MASCVLSAADGTSASVYGDIISGITVNADYRAIVGVGDIRNQTDITQTNVTELQGGVSVSKLVGLVSTGLLQADGLTIAPRALVASCIGTGIFLGAGAAVVVTTAASDNLATIFVTPQPIYNNAVNPPTIATAAATGSLKVSAVTASSFSVVSSDATDAGAFSWWIVNPSYS